MMTDDPQERVLLLRRQVLRALAEAGPLPLRREELADYALLPPCADPAAELTRELEHLRLWGFVKNLRADPAQPGWWRLTPRGLTQIRGETRRLDPRLWGRRAL